LKTQQIQRAAVFIGNMQVIAALPLFTHWKSFMASPPPRSGMQC